MPKDMESASTLESEEEEGEESRTSSEVRKMEMQ